MASENRLNHDKQRHIYVGLTFDYYGVEVYAYTYIPVT